MFNKEQEEFKELWVDKYRPKKLSEMVLDSSVRDIFETAIENKNLTNCLLLGPPGYGKTVLARVLAAEFNSDPLFIPCAMEGGIETLRTKIKQFVSAYSDGLKIVILDELDSASASQESSFQRGLRNLIEMSPDTRFICTANYDKIIPAVKSRCPPINITFSSEDILKRVLDIADLERVAYTIDDVKEINKIIDFHFPDIRSILTNVQRHVKDGKFNFTKNMGLIEDSDNIIKMLVADLIANKPLLSIRRTYIKVLGKTADYLGLSSELFSYVLEKDIVKEPEYLRKLTQSIYEINMCVDKEIAFFGMVCIIYAVRQKQSSS